MNKLVILLTKDVIMALNNIWTRKKEKNYWKMLKKYGYSPEKLRELKVYVDEWNQDCVTNDVLDSFRVIEEFVKDNQEQYKGNIMYKFSKFLSDEGRNLNEN